MPAAPGTRTDTADSVTGALPKRPSPAGALWLRWRSEPYRLLFPLGLGLALFGLGVWTLFYAAPGALAYPGRAHAIVQAEGFMLAFVFGFLLTMLPRVLGLPIATSAELAGFAAGLVGVAASALSGHPAFGHACFLATLGLFLAFLGRRLRGLPPHVPTTFVHIPLAMAAALAGGVCLWLGESGLAAPAAIRLGTGLVSQGFLLLLLLGITPFLLPKLQGNLPVTMPGRGRGSVALSAALGAALIASFIPESLWPGDAGLRAAYAIRAAAFLWLALGRLRLHRWPKGLPAHMRAARWSLAAIAWGLAMPVLLPRYTLAWEHAIFIPGFTWLTLSIAGRVVAGHGGKMEALTRHRKAIWAYGILVLIGASARISTGIWPAAYTLHLAFASTCVLAAMGIWAAIFLSPKRSSAPAA